MKSPRLLGQAAYARGATRRVHLRPFHHRTALELSGSGYQPAGATGGGADVGAVNVVPRRRAPAAFAAAAAFAVEAAGAVVGSPACAPEVKADGAGIRAPPRASSLVAVRRPVLRGIV
ncbi:hypothetical protein GCM10023147_07890 [Tsukamurella soli]|uniref:DUF4236 domain-containing protein n=1 Tax=Tsukamurella soli TaxID=644556 RepID=A0ABP8J6J7_9ACTN